MTYLLIGAFARVIQGADEVTEGLDIVPSRNLARLAEALRDLGAERADGKQLALEAESIAREAVLALRTEHGELKVVPEPAGTRGYDDLRWHASGEHIGKGLRPRVASTGDLARMLAALGREEDLPKLMALRRIMDFELTRGMGLEL
ncbi:MAG: hypothetical protein ACRDLA_00265 [Thermoleophilaceae bacterium]